MPETKTTLAKRLAAPVLIAISLAFPVGIAANTNEQLAKTGGMTVELPLLGGSLTVEVKLDLVGHISEVNLAPAATVSQTKSGEHNVRFASADGTVKVDVKAKGSNLSVKARAGSLGALSGNGTWSADVFGTGTASTVGYKVGATADGHPTLTIGTPVVPDGTFELSPVKVSKDGKRVSGKVTFKRDGYTKRLSISIAVMKDGKASLRTTLSGRDKQKLSGLLADLVGTRTWSAHTCDAKPVSVEFRVTGDGKVAFVSANPSTVKVKAQKNGFKATFDGTRVSVSVKLKQGKDGRWTLNVDGKSDKCGKHDRDTKDKSGKKDKKSDSERKDKKSESGRRDVLREGES